VIAALFTALIAPYLIDWDGHIAIPSSARRPPISAGLS
jgi:hypothetical protein